MARAARQTEYRWAVIRDYYTENGDNCTDMWVVIFGTEDEAKECMARLNDPERADRSFHDPDDVDANSFLYVDRIAL